MEPEGKLVMGLRKTSVGPLRHESASHNFAGGEISKSYARHRLNSDKLTSPDNQRPSHPSSIQSPSSPLSKAASTKVGRKIKPPSPRGSVLSPDYDSKSMFSVQSEQNKRHSIAGSSVRDDESLASSPAVPSYMVSTQSAKAKSRLQSSLGMENVTPEKGSAGNAKKLLSFPASPARPRRHSGPPRLNATSVADHNVNDITVNHSGTEGNIPQKKLEPKNEEHMKFGNGRVVGPNALAEQNADLTSELKCSLCNTFFKEAVMIPCCQHSFCEKYP